MRTASLTIVTCATLLWGSTAHAASAEAKCLGGRASAKARFERCVDGAVGPAYMSGGTLGFVIVSGKCGDRLWKAWTKLQRLAGSATCGSQPRYVDNGDGTVTDNMTGLMWEKKSDDGSIHDKDSRWTWSTGPPYKGNGTAFTSFLAVDPTSLNEVGFAGANDWRMPTLAELQSILPRSSFPCPPPGVCIDPAFDTGCSAGCNGIGCSCTHSGYFSPIDDGFYWSAATDARNPAFAVYKVFGHNWQTFDKTGPGYVRAVRGGL